MTARGFKPKTQLTPEEKITAAYLHICWGVDQHILVAQYMVNQGRINDAIAAVKAAVGLPVTHYNKGNGEEQSVLDDVRERVTSSGNADARSEDTRPGGAIGSGGVQELPSRESSGILTFVSGSHN